ncbi:MAG: HD-GYP domain-containing protein [bacterium]
MNYVVKNFQPYSISVYNKKVYKEDYVFIPTDLIFFFIVFLFYQDLSKILFIYLGFLFNSFFRKFFLGRKEINIVRNLFSTFSFFFPLFILNLVLKLFVSSYYQFHFYLIGFVSYLFLNKFLTMWVLEMLGEVKYGGVLRILGVTLRVGLAEGFLFSQFTFTYISFILFVNGSFLSFFFLMVLQLLFLRFLYSANNLLSSYENLVDFLLRLLQEYDCDIYEHSERVAEVAKILAQSIGLSKNEVDSIYLASKLHDIGKIDIPSFILNKEGSLSKAEFKIITLHPLVAYSIVQDIVSEKESQFIKYHHFYPTVFNKPVTYEDLPIGARIIMLADVYDALRSKRKYKPPLSHEQAVNEISSMIQKKLIDPQIFSVLLSNYDKIKNIYEN